jgi:hypothetical protein
LAEQKERTERYLVNKAHEQVVKNELTNMGFVTETRCGVVISYQKYFGVRCGETGGDCVVVKVHAGSDYPALWIEAAGKHTVVIDNTSWRDFRIQTNNFQTLSALLDKIEVRYGTSKTAYKDPDSGCGYSPWGRM